MFVKNDRKGERLSLRASPNGGFSEPEGIVALGPEGREYYPQTCSTKTAALDPPQDNKRSGP